MIQLSISSSYKSASLIFKFLRGELRGEVLDFLPELLLDLLVSNLLLSLAVLIVEIVREVHLQLKLVNYYFFQILDSIRIEHLLFQQVLCRSSEVEIELQQLE